MHRRVIIPLCAAVFGGCIGPPPDANPGGVDGGPPDAPEVDGGVDVEAVDGSDGSDLGPPTVVMESEPNDSPDQAPLFAPGDHIAGQADDSSMDWWSFSVNERPAILEVEKLRFEDSDGDPRNDSVAIMVFPADQSISERVYDTRDAQVRRFFIATTGEYYLRVEDDGDRPIYEFAVRLVDVPIPIDGGRDSTQQGNLSNFWPDVYLYNAPDDAAITVTLKSASSGYDPFLIATRANGELLQYNDDYGDGEGAFLELSVQSGEAYWLVATGYNMPPSGTNYRFEIAPR